MPATSGGETEKDPSGWTVDTLGVHMQTQLADLHRMLDERFEAQDKAVRSALEAAHAVLVEHDKRYEQRFTAQEGATALALSRVDKEFHEHLQQVRTETHAALEAAEKAITKAEIATEKRFESVNEFRAQLSDQTRTFMPRTESLQRHEQNGEKIIALENRHAADVAQINSRLDLSAGSATGADKFRATMLALAGAVVGIVGLVAALLAR